ncbi:MAG TPA: ParB/RepB/Spo0J family partition protein [Clostridia bacterium]|nr:ParB/RepB/Spo0J family partition protein [Clostridia bacterium]
MAARKSGLGRGLDALFADNSVEEGSLSSAVKLKLMDIEPNKEQPRKNFDEDSLSELAESISKYGVIQPLLVRPLTDGAYQLVAGERRWRAARIAGLTEVPVVIKELSDDEAMALALIENLQREDLNPIEEALGYQLLMDKFSLTQEETADRVGKSRPAIANALRLLRLPSEVTDMVNLGKVSAGHARALLSFKDETTLVETAHLIDKKGLSVREVERLARSSNKEKSTQGQSTRRDSFFDEVELSLTQGLCRRAKVITKSKSEAGTLEIAFYDKEDLNRIASALNSVEE